MPNMDMIEGWLPPSRENWELVAWSWQFFPVVTAVQWVTDFFPQGKTSIESRLNLPGKYAWLVMETPGFLVVNYLMFTLPSRLGLERLPLSNWAMAGLFTIHYLYRAWVAPLFLNPSMSPIHPLVAVSASVWQVMNGLSMGGWLAGYGPTNAELWQGRPLTFGLGLMLWVGGFLSNIYHDDVLREIRRKAQREKQANDKRGSSEDVSKVYRIPEGGLFSLILYPHFFCEWIEWSGYWAMGGLGCLPARSFLFNEVSTMLPRALGGTRWYVEKFGKDKIGSRKAAIPWLI